MFHVPRGCLPTRVFTCWDFRLKKRQAWVTLPLAWRQEHLQASNNRANRWDSPYKWSSSLLDILSRLGRHGLASNHVAHGELFLEWSSCELEILSRPARSSIFILGLDVRVATTTLECGDLSPLSLSDACEEERTRSHCLYCHPGKVKAAASRSTPK